MISEANRHQKHANLHKPAMGEFGRNELAILGTTCANIRSLAEAIIQDCGQSFKIAFADADHPKQEITAVETREKSLLNSGAFVEFTDKISFRRIDLSQPLSAFHKRTSFNEVDLMLINGNHFAGQQQVVVIDPVKPLEKKLDKLTDVRLILLKESNTLIPEYIKSLVGFNTIPVLLLQQSAAIANFVASFMQQQLPSLHGLVLAGGQSSRMHTDKATLNYHGTSQQQHVYQLLAEHCSATFVSCNSRQANGAQNEPFIDDTFLGIGPLGGILSAFQSNPNVAWLTVACDLPFLSQKTLSHLVQHRNPSKLATAFMDSDSRFPEPLVTIWEPRSYAVMLQFLSQGYSCPRKVLINSDVALLQAPDVQEFTNVNTPAEREQAMQHLKPVS